MNHIKVGALVFGSEGAETKSRSQLGFVYRIDDRGYAHIRGLDGTTYTEEVEHLQVAADHNVIDYVNEAFKDDQKVQQMVKGLIFCLSELGKQINNQ